LGLFVIPALDKLTDHEIDGSVSKIYTFGQIRQGWLTFIILPTKILKLPDDVFGNLEPVLMEKFGSVKGEALYYPSRIVIKFLANKKTK
jgi:hypothetical protein